MTDRSILSSINRPGRYLGSEFNSIVKNWETAKVRFALIFPDLYEIGMSHQGLQILYHILNNHENFLAERCYSPDIDVEKQLRSSGKELISLESAHSLSEFDILGITLPYELCYTNILTILSLASIPIYSKDRDSSFPLVLGGGACSLNPEPVADFFDAVLLGDGEEAIVEIGTAFSKYKEHGVSKSDLLDLLSTIDGVYIPSHFKPHYNDAGIFTGIEPTTTNKTTVTRRTIADLNEIDHLKKPLVPNAKIVHDRLGIEVARGCTRGCRFCQAGITYRPVRERHPDKITELAETALTNSGFEELALLSLSTGDYSCLEQVLPQLMDRFTKDYISVAMPSMRVGTLTPTVMDQIKRVRKTGFTLAPEAGSERMRRVINKGITEEDLMSTCEIAFELGWRLIKFYFMIGLPTETEEDIDAIAHLIKKAMATRGHGQSKGKRQINVSVGTFVPKPHTPFQWEQQLSIDQSWDHIKRLKDKLPRRGCNLRYHNPKVSYLEGVFSRGDRRLAKLLEIAWQDGARFDGWDEHFDLSRWKQGAEKCGIILDTYLQKKAQDEQLPWQHLQTGVDLDFLKDEFEKATEQVYTPDCRYHGCQQCGLCDFETLSPIVYSQSQDSVKTSATAQRQDQQDTHHFKYMVHYSRIGDVCYLGHLEILQMIFRLLRRASIPTNYSQGFNPSPKISFGPALPVGTESLAEYFIMDLTSPLKNLEATVNKLNKSIIPGLQVTKIEPHSGKIPQVLLLSYQLSFEQALSDGEIASIEQFFDSDEFIIKKTRKGKTKDIDIRPLVKKIDINNPTEISLQIISASAQPGIKPIEAIKEILEREMESLAKVKIKKLSWQPLD